MSRFSRGDIFLRNGPSWGYNLTTHLCHYCFGRLHESGEATADLPGVSWCYRGSESRVAVGIFHGPTASAATFNLNFFRPCPSALDPSDNRKRGKMDRLGRDTSGLVLEIQWSSVG